MYHKFINIRKSLSWLLLHPWAFYCDQQKESGKRKKWISSFILIIKQGTLVAVTHQPSYLQSSKVASLSYFQYLLSLLFAPFPISQCHTIVVWNHFHDQIYTPCLPKEFNKLELLLCLKKDMYWFWLNDFHFYDSLGVEWTNIHDLHNTQTIIKKN